MDSVHLHLLVNHVPILGSMFAFLLFVAGLVRKRTEVARAGLWAMVAVALLTVPAYLSGREAEEHVKRLPGVSTIVMEEHEEAALPAMLTIEGAGLLSLIAIAMGRGGQPLPRWVAGAVVVISVLGIALMARAGNLGGQVRHSEIRSGAAAGGAEHEDGREDH